MVLSDLKLKKRNRKGKNTATYIFLSIISLFILLPIIWMFMTSVKPTTETFAIPVTFLPKVFDISAYQRIWTNYSFIDYFKNSFSVVICSTLIAMAFSCLAGYGVSRFNFKGKASFLSFLLITQMFPFIMLLIPFYKTMITYGLSNTYIGLILPYISFTIPFCTWMMMGYFDTIPKSLDEAANIDGCSTFQTFFRIILPLAIPGLVATGIYSFIQGWNEYMFAMTLTSSETMKTIPVGIAQLTSENRTQWNDMMAASTVAGVPVTIVFLLLQKYLVSGLASGAVKQ
ncbi:MAG: carbohydrate ABC transporter permease [Ruminiclostridium sp.]